MDFGVFVTIILILQNSWYSFDDNFYFIYISQIYRTCYYQIGNLRRICLNFSLYVAKANVTAVVTSTLKYSLFQNIAFKLKVRILQNYNVLNDCLVRL